MLEALGEWMSFPLYYTFEGQLPPPRNGAAHATIFPYGPFPAGDGKTVMLGLQNEREWKVFCEAVLGQPEVATDPRFESNVRRVENRGALTACIVRAFAGLSAAEVMARLDRAGIANARVNEMHEVWSHPQLTARGRWRTIGSPVGELPALLPPAGLDGAEPRMGAVPALGEHTAAILGELGFSEGELERLHGAGVV